jgi:Lon protease-like protein
MAQADQIEIPLFPLPSLVFFPGVMLPLHIFEERYKAMIRTCVQENAPFGVVLVEGESESASTIRRVGVLGRVVQVERFDDGRMNILTEGEARFRVVKFLGQHPHWRALVELLDDEREPEPVLESLGEQMASLYLDAYRKGLELTGKEGGELRLPTSPIDLSYMVAYVLDMDLDAKQALLETTSGRERLRLLIRYLTDANTKLDQQLSRKRVGEVVSRNGDLGRPAGSGGKEP